MRPLNEAYWVVDLIDFVVVFVLDDRAVWKMSLHATSREFKLTIDSIEIQQFDESIRPSNNDEVVTLMKRHCSYTIIPKSFERWAFLVLKMDIELAKSHWFASSWKLKISFWQTVKRSFLEFTKKTMWWHCWNTSYKMTARAEFSTKKNGTIW